MLLMVVTTVVGMPYADIFAMNQHVLREANDLYVVRHAVMRCERMLLSLDAHATALTRMWCLYELWAAAQVLLYS